MRERPPTSRRRPTRRRAPRRRALGFPGLLEPVALPARAARGVVREPVPQAGQGRVPALPADPRVAGPRRADPPGGQGHRDQEQPHAGRARADPPGHPLRPLVPSGAQGRRATGVRWRAQRALRAVAGLGREGPAGVGDGLRAGRDVAPVGPDRGAHRPALGGAARRAPAQAHVREPALGPQAGAGGRHRAGDVVRHADRRRPRRGLRADRPGALPRPVHPPGAGGGRVGHAAPLPGGERGAGRGDPGARGARAPARHPRRRPDALRLLRRARSGDGHLRPPLRPLVARRAPDAAGPALVHARAADQPQGGRGRRRAAGRLAPGRSRAAADLSLRARLRPRRCDRPRATQAADGAELSRLRMAGPGDATGARRGPAPVAAEGHPQAAHPGARGGGQRAQAPATAQRAAVGGARSGDRGAAQGAESRRTPGISPGCPRT